MVLAELAGGVAERLEEFRDSRVFLLQADGGTGHADLGQTRADRVLASDEARPAGGTALLGIVVGEGNTLVRDAVDVGCAVAHHAEAEAAEVRNSDVIAPQYEDVGLIRFGHLDLLWQVWWFQNDFAAGMSASRVATRSAATRHRRQRCRSR